MRSQLRYVSVLTLDAPGQQITDAADRQIRDPVEYRLQPGFGIDAIEDRLDQRVNARGTLVTAVSADEQIIFRPKATLRVFRDVVIDLKRTVITVA